MLDSSEEVEPMYGKTYLPRKFKIGIALPPSNDIDVYSQDIGLIAIVDHDELIGFNVLVGGGMGMTHGNKIPIHKSGVYWVIYLKKKWSMFVKRF